ncbi:MAG: hypothetical protein GY859_20750 [Desulfobacterales bacterium]|nr:hypothetical protein [Desulfobacterales bacterium]
MSVGHVARLLEESGIATVIVAVQAFENRMRMMALPRTVLTPHLIGRPFGAPGDVYKQRAVVTAGLELLENATHGGAVLKF